MYRVSVLSTRDISPGQVLGVFQEKKYEFNDLGHVLLEKNQQRILKPENVFCVSLLTRLIQNQSKESSLGKDSSVPFMHHGPGLICLVKKNKICFSDLRVQS